MRNYYDSLSIRLSLLKADCLQALNHVRAVEFSQDARAVRRAHDHFLLVKQFLNDLMMECPDDLAVNDPLVKETMELLNFMSRKLVTIRKK